MRFLFLCGIITLAAASQNHNILLLKTETPTTEYRKEDVNGFYSYGYIGDDSAKAEYKTRDGSSKGFYAYIDSEGKLQTVKYEASREQGFTASATNLPTPPMENSQAPLPVKDTPEVEMAKQAHFEAYHEAALKAAMAPDNGDEEESTSSAENQIATEDLTQLERELQQNTRELLMSRQSTRDHLLSLLREQQEMSAEEINSRESQPQSQQHPQQMTTYILNAEARLEHPSHSDLRTIYRLDSSDSNVQLKRGDFSLPSNIQHQTINLEAHRDEEQDSLSTFESFRLPSNSYHSDDSHNTHYSIETPTVLTTLPRILSIRLGKHHSPISLSSAFSSQRLNGKSSSTRH